MIFTFFKEYKTAPRSKDVLDESIYDFISRRVGSTIAENLVDPIMKGICGGNIKELSAASLLKNFYDAEMKAGSVIKGMLSASKQKSAFDKLCFF